MSDSRLLGEGRNCEVQVPMSFESAVAADQVIGMVCSILWLALPVTAVMSILRRRRYRPGSGNLLAYIVLGGWIFTVAVAVVSFLTGAWYGENGPSPQIAVIEGTMILLVMLAIHVALIRTSALPKEGSGDST